MRMRRKPRKRMGLPESEILARPRLSFCEAKTSALAPPSPAFAFSGSLSIAAGEGETKIHFATRLPCRTSTIPIRPNPEPKWIPPRTHRTAAPHSNTAAASMAFMLHTAVFLFDGCRCGRGYLKTSGEDW